MVDTVKKGSEAICITKDCENIVTLSTTGKCREHAYDNWTVSKNPKLKTRVFYVDDIDAAYKELL